MSQDSCSETQTVSISVVGDCTLGKNQYIPYENSWDDLFDKKGPGYFFKNVRHHFEASDIAIANLEGVLSDDAPQQKYFKRVRVNEIQPRQYIHGGKREHVDALKEGGIDVVTFSNNHNIDYGLKGFTDTIETCEAAGIPIAYYDHVVRKKVGDITVGIISLDVTYCTDRLAEQYLRRGMADLRRDCQLIIVCPHWGANYVEHANERQQKLGHLCVDLGADAVYGSHAHILQGVERYKGRYIFYSLGNFCYGGRAVPKDPDTAIVKQVFTFVDGKLRIDDDLTVIPCSMSGRVNANDFQPIRQFTEAAQDIFGKINERSVEYGLALGVDGRPVVEPATDTELPPCDDVFVAEDVKPVPEIIDMLLGTVDVVGPGYFADETAENVAVPVSCTTVKAGALTNRPNMRRVMLPEELSLIEDGAFDKDFSGNFWCVEDSYALWRIVELCPGSRVRVFSSMEAMRTIWKNDDKRRREQRTWKAVTPDMIAKARVGGLTYHEAAAFLERAYRDQRRGKTLKEKPQKIYRAKQVAALKQGMEEGKLIEVKPLPYVSRLFRARYFVAKRELAAQIRLRAIRLSTLCDFLGAKVPSELSGSEDPVTSTIAFRGYQCKSGCFFVCFEYQDKLAARVKRAGVSCVIGPKAYRAYFKEEGIPYVVCPGAASKRGAALCDIASFWRQQYPKVKTVSITGSVGKTTTTEMTNLVCESAFNTLVRRKNFNLPYQAANQIQNLTDDTEVIVQEVAGSLPGLAETSMSILQPDVFVITNVGNSHIELYGGDHYSLLYEKISGDRRASDDGVGVVCYDDPLLRKVPFKHRVVGFAIEDQTADVVAKNIVEGAGKISFDVVEKTGESTPVTIHAFGKHNVLDALAAFATGVLLGMDRQAVAAALALFRPRGIRQNLVQLAGRNIYLDCYNSSESSVKSILEAAQSIPVPEGARKIAVLGDIKQTGDEDEAIHSRVGELAAKAQGIDETFFFGESMAFAKKRADELGATSRHTVNREELARWILEDTAQGDLVCFKASHAVGFHRLVDKIFGTAFYLEDIGVAVSATPQIDGVEYKVIPEHGTCVSDAREGFGDISVPDELEGLLTRSVLDGAFAECGVRSVTLADSITGIGVNAFSGCASLESVKLPANLLLIDNGAFSGCAHLTSIDIPDGCQTIGGNAFSGCESLRQVRIPASVLTIGDAAFPEGTTAEFVCDEGSYASRRIAEVCPEAKIVVNGM